MTASKENNPILVVDDDETTRETVRLILEKKDYPVRLARDGDEALDAANATAPQLVILDLSLPGLSGIDVCKGLRSWYTKPILVLSGYQDEGSIVEALDSGADDYLTKPFRAGELLARIRALLLRSAAGSAQPEVTRIGELEFDRVRRRVLRSGKEIKLTRKEFEIFAYLIENLDCVVTHNMMLDRLWGPQHGDYTQSLRVHVGHLRQKIERDPANPQYILTELAVGYRFSMPAPAL